MQPARTVPRCKLTLPMPRCTCMIGILFTGGTISMKLDPGDRRAVPALGVGTTSSRRCRRSARCRRHRDRRLLAPARAARHAGSDVAPGAARGRLARAAGRRRPRHHARHRHDRGNGVSARPRAARPTSRSCWSARCAPSRTRAGTARRICSPPCAWPPAPPRAATACSSSMDEHILPAREVRKVHTESSSVVRDAGVRAARRRRCGRGASSVAGRGARARPGATRRPNRACVSRGSRRAWSCCRPTRA